MQEVLCLLRGGYKAGKGQGFFFRALNFDNISPDKVLLLPLGSKGHSGAPWDSTWQLENSTLACMFMAQQGAGKESRGKQVKREREEKQQVLEVYLRQTLVCYRLVKGSYINISDSAQRNHLEMASPSPPVAVVTLTNSM